MVTLVSLKFLWLLYFIVELVYNSLSLVLIIVCGQICVPCQCYTFVFYIFIDISIINNEIWCSDQVRYYISDIQEISLIVVLTSEPRAIYIFCGRGYPSLRVLNRGNSEIVLTTTTSVLFIDPRLGQFPPVGKIVGCGYWLSYKLLIGVI